MKILHLIVDHQVIERTLGVYESILPKTNEAVVFSPTKEKHTHKHLTNHKDSLVVTAGKGAEVGSTFDFSSFTHIIAHYLTLDMIAFIKEAPANIHVTWEIYGWDLYNQFLTPNGFKLTYTDPAPYTKYGYWKKYMPNLYDIVFYLTGHYTEFSWQKKKAFDYICSRVDALQHCCLYDSKYVEEYANRTIPSYEVFNYSLDEVLGNLKDVPFFDGKDIMVGNSASYSNNHLYVLNYLKKVGISDDSRIVMPLSYGGSQKYADKVQDSFMEVWGERVYTLRSYLPLHKYNKTFLCLKSMVLSAWRQESIGTAIMGFYLGIKVFMSERSPLYKWLKACGFIVYTIESATYEDLNTGLSESEKLQNRNKVLDKYDASIFEETIKYHFK